MSESAPIIHRSKSPPDYGSLFNRHDSEEFGERPPSPPPHNRMSQSFFRSADMSLCQLFLQSDAAYACVAELGEIGLAQFRDLNEDMNAYQRKFVNEIRRCDEMERKLRFIEEEIVKDEVTIVETTDRIRAPQPKDMNDLEATFEKIEEELLAINTNTKTLEDNHTKLWEMAQVIDKVRAMLDAGQTRVHAASLINEQATGIAPLIEDSSSEAKDGKGTELKLVTGVIAKKKVLAFEKFLWRLCKGKVFMRTMDTDTEMDIFGKSEGEKSVFVLFFSGDQLAARVTKICAGFHARVYNCPEDPGARAALKAQIDVQLADLQNVIGRTLEHRTRVIIAASQSIYVWKIKVLKIKMVFNTLNMFSIDITQKCLVAECWIPSADMDEVRHALRNGTLASGSLVHPVLNEMEHHETAPTYFTLNKFTQGYQNIVNAYGVADYKEMNPAPWSIISFPFIFAVMFGDMGHAAIMFLAAFSLVIFEDKINAAKIKDEIFNTFFGGRYIILLMSMFALYTGLVYNDIYSKSIDIFGSSWGGDACWSWTGIADIGDWEVAAAKENQTFEIMLDPIYCMKNDTVYPFGVDPVWNLASNKLNFLNSMKMKSSVILGIGQMTFGLIMSLCNHIRNRSLVDIFFMFIPQMLFLGCIFMYLCVQIILKWIYFSVYPATIFGQYYPGSSCAPNLLIGLIDMFMMTARDPGFMQTGYMNGTTFVVDPTGNITRNNPDCSTGLWYPHEDGVEKILLVVAVLSIPVMLLVKPFYIKFRHSRGLSIPHSHGDEGGEFSFGDVMVYQAIHTIEFALGCVSHTASYLRLWALSLAHAQLSEVLWTMLLHMAFTPAGYVGAAMQFIIFILFAVLSLGILVLMEGLSAFLHALRLHWVEFQSKFYSGNGILFEPFYFEKQIRIAEGLDV